MNKYEIIFRDNVSIVVESEVFIFNDEFTGVIDSDVVAVNAKDILYIKKVNNNE